jgi:CMP-N-acetylneuraminic acid synthetase
MGHAMTPLIIVPARQFSEGQPCKNREHWADLVALVMSLPSGWPWLVVTDDPWIANRVEMALEPHWLPMGPAHTVAQAVAHVCKCVAVADRDGPVIVLQPSSPTRNRASYALAAVEHLRAYSQASAVVSVVPWTGEPPSKACTLAADGTLLVPRVSPEPRQLQPRHYRRDGTVYVVRAEYARQGDLYGPRPVPLLIDPRDSLTID